MTYDSYSKDMKLFSWGSNSHGQLGQGSDQEQILIATQIELGIDGDCVTGGGKHTVLLTRAGEIFTCGDNDKGQLGKERTLTSLKLFQPLSCSFKVVQVSCGWDFNLALTDCGEVLGWGANSYGQLGLNVKKVSYLSAPSKLIDKKIVSIGTGLRHSAIVTSNGLVLTSGFGRKGQLGFLVNGDPPLSVDKFTQAQNLNDCLQVSCGECHCIAETKSGNVYAWGNNRFGQLGIDPNTTPFTHTPTQVNIPVSTPKKNSLFSGWTHNLILTGEGEVITWGRNDFGQLGEQRKQNWKPQEVKNLENIKQVSVGSHHSVALTSSGEVVTWGWNEHGNCGNGNCVNVEKPHKLKGVAGVKFIGSGAAHSFFCLPMSGNGPEGALEIPDSDLQPSAVDQGLTKIPVINNNVDYSEFFHSFLLPNKPCVVDGVSQNWPCTHKWIKNNTLDVDYFIRNYRNTEVPISDCGKREFNVQKKCSMKLFDYLDYWEGYRESSGLKECLYLKDWHFVKEYPREDVYRVPRYFASDWLNEYYDNNLELNDDYRFVYIGPKGSWTPFHADVFTSYSWSVNVSGRKKWILIPPGAENHFRDDLGNLNYDVDLSEFSRGREKKTFPMFEIIQEEGQGLFVPSGWHHQVWNMEDTISVNHNWINGCNVHHVWESLKNNLSDVMREISDCRDMENWASQCQLVLSASFGIDYRFFHSFLLETAKRRMNAVKAREKLPVYGNWFFGENHMIFDLKRILAVLNWLEKDEHFLEIATVENSLNHSLEFLDSLNGFLNQDL